MHRKSDSEATSVEASTPPRSPRRPLYYVQSPSHPDAEKMSYGSITPAGSPVAHHYHYHYHCSPVHHSRESSTSRFSASLKNHLPPAANALALGWKGGRRRGLLFGDVDGQDDNDDEEEEDDAGGPHSARFYVACFLICFVILFSAFSLILWGASKSYSPRVFVQRVAFKDLTLQAGMDHSGIPTDMLSLNSTVRIYYRNRGTFFGVHVASTPLELYFYNLKLASGQMNKFYESRKSDRYITTVVRGYQVPLYGGMSSVSDARVGDHVFKDRLHVGLNLTFTVRSRAYILGRLVKSNFNTRIRCPLTLDGTRLGNRLKIADSCIYQ